MGALDTSSRGVEDRLGRYRLRERLGRGGMASVYRALDTDTGTLVALKRLEGRAVKDRHATALFRHEFHTLRRLQHPSIVEAYEWHADPDGPYYTMELLDGRDLGTMAPLEWRRACEILRDVASALALVHVQQLVYRDVSGRNVRVTSEGKAKLLDFGALCTAGTSPSHTVATPANAAPEVVMGRPLDQRTDLYGLGALAYASLTGRMAFAARGFGDLASAWRKRPAAPSSLVEGIPAGLDVLVLQLLSLNPLARPNSMAEVAHRLTELAQLTPLPEDRTAHGYLASAALVGRDREIQRLEAELRDVAGGERRVLLVEAPSGYGKSRLVREAELRAKVFEFRVARADGGPAPYGVADELAASVARQLDDEDLDSTLVAASASIADRCPALRERLEGAGISVRPEPVSIDAGDERQRRVEGFCRFFEAAARRVPLLLVTDDVQRADLASLSVLAELADEGRPLTLGLLMGWRTDEVSAARGPLAHVRRGSRSIELQRFDVRDMEALIRASFGDVERLGRFSSWVAEASEGIPMAAVHILEDLVERRVVRYEGGFWRLPIESPDHVVSSLSEAADRRIAGLSAEARAVAGAMSVHGGRLRLSEVVELVGQPIDEVLTALEELESQQFVLAEDGTYAFRHDSLREAAGRTLSDEQRRRFHGRVGEILLSEDPSPGQQTAGGFHLLEAGLPEKAAPWLEQVGRHFLGEGALPEAARALTAAIEVYDEDPARRLDTLRLQRAVLEPAFFCDRRAMITHGPRAFEELRQRAGIDRVERWSTRIGRLLAVPLGLLHSAIRGRFRQNELELKDALELMGWTISWLGTSASSVLDIPLLRACVNALEPFEHPLLRKTDGAVLLHHTRAILLHIEGRWNRSAAESARAWELAQRILPGEHDRKLMRGGALLAHSSGIAPMHQGSPVWLEHAAAVSELGVRHLSSTALVWTRHYHLVRGEAGEAARVEAQFEAETVRSGANVHVEIVQRELQLVRILLGDDIASLRTLRQELDALEPWHRWSDSYDAFAAPYLAALEAFLLKGDAEGCLAQLDRAERSLEDLGCALREELGRASELRARALLSRGDPQGALALSPRAAEFEADGRLEQAVRLRAQVGLAQAELGRIVEARAELGHCREVADGICNPALSGWLWEVQAEVEAKGGDDFGRRRAVERMCEHYAQCDSPSIQSRLDRLRHRGGTGLAPDLMAVSDVYEVTSDRTAVLGASAPAPRSRAEAVLELLLDATLAERGFVFRYRQAGPELCAGGAAAGPSDAILAAVRMHRDAPGGEVPSLPEGWRLVPLGAVEAPWGAAVLHRPALGHDRALHREIEQILTRSIPPSGAADGFGRQGGSMPPASGA